MDLNSLDIIKNKPIEWYYFNSCYIINGKLINIMICFFILSIPSDENPDDSLLDVKMPSSSDVSDKAVVVNYMIYNEDNNLFSSASVASHNLLTLFKNSKIIDPSLKSILINEYSKINDEILNHNFIINNNLSIIDPKNSFSFIKKNDCYKIFFIDKLFGPIKLKFMPNKKFFFQGTENFRFKKLEMQYYSISNNKVLLNFNNQKYIGKGWFDHQYGNEMRTIDNHGWLWLGFFMKDSQEVTITYLLGENSGYIQIIHKDSSSVIIEDFHLEILDWFYSPKSFNKYPSCIRIICSDFSCLIQIKNQCQEIETILTLGAYYEGLIDVEFFDGCLGKGIGFIEFKTKVNDKNDFTATKEWLLEKSNNYYLNRYENFSNDFFEINGLDIDFNDTFIQEHVFKPMIYTINGSCSAFRSIMSVLTLRLFSDNLLAINMVSDFQIYIEMLQTASLIIDDIQDKALFRRGKICAYRVFDPNNCYLSAQLATLDHTKFIDKLDISIENKYNLFKRLNRGIKLVHIGQIMDISQHNIDKLFADFITSKNNNSNILLENLSNINKLKTGAAIATCMELSGFVASIFEKDFDLNNLNKLHSFGLEFGNIYQIVNDSQDILKKKGEDLIANKITIPMVLILLKESDPDIFHNIGHFILKKNKTNLEIETLLKYFNSYDLFKIVNDYINNIFDKMWQILDTFTKPSVHKIKLKIMHNILFN